LRPGESDFVTQRREAMLRVVTTLVLATVSFLVQVYACEEPGSMTSDQRYVGSLHSGRSLTPGENARIDAIRFEAGLGQSTAQAGRPS
jgi:hypothetical protein